MDKKTLRDLHDMFTGDRAAEPDLAAVVPPVEEPAPEPSVEEQVQDDPPAQETNGLIDEEADEFLAAIETPATGKDLKNLDDLLDDLDL